MTKNAERRPALGNRYIEVERVRLLEQIQPEFCSGNLLLLTAGPGTGKTFLVQQLLRQRHEKTAYLDLKKLSSDLGFLVRQLEDLFSDLWPDVFHDLHPKKIKNFKDFKNQRSPLEKFDALLDKLLLCGELPAVIALDGCEVLADRPSWVEMITIFLTRFPSFVSIILASTVPLKIPPLATLRLQGRLLELTTKDLHFDRQETHQFISKNLPWLTQEDTEQIRKKVGGWPAGLSLLCFEIRKKGRMSPIHNISPETLYDYLQSEVLNSFSSEDLQILCTAALLDSFDHSLLQIFLPVTNKKFTALFSSLSFFLDRTDETNDHKNKNNKKIARLYAEFFCSRANDILGHRVKKKLHKKAAKYYKKTGETEQALTHLVALEDWTATVKLILTDHKKWLHQEHYEQLLSWIGQLPASSQTQHPRIAVLLGHAHLYLGNLDRAVNAFRMAFKYARPDSRDWLESGCRLCEVLLLKGCLTEAVELADRLVKRSRFTSRFRAEAMMFQAIGLHLLCRLEECTRLWHHIQTIAQSSFLPINKTSRCYLMAPKAVFYNLERGDFEESERILDHSINVFRNRDPRKRLGWTLLFMGVLKLELHQYTEAITWFREAMVVSYKTNRSVYAGCTAFLSFTLAVQDQKEEALQWYKQAEPLIAKDLTLWAPVLCALVQAQLAHQPQEALRGLNLAWNLAIQRKMLLPIALTAYTSFAVCSRIQRKDLSVLFCSRAAEICHERNVHHREAQILLYLHLMQAESDKTEKPEQLIRSLHLISENNLGFLLTDDKKIDGLELVIQALEMGIMPDFYLRLCSHWGERAYDALVPLFLQAPLKLKLKIVQTWTQNNFKKALPHIERLILTIKRKRTATQLNLMVQQLKATPPDPLHIQLFGSFSLMRGDNILPSQAWKRLKAKELFKLFCLYPDTAFTQDQLIELFWPESSPDKAKTILWSTISAFKSALEPELPARKKSSYLQGSSLTYKLKLPNGSTIDTLLFKEKAKKGFYYQKKGDLARALLYFESAVNIYRDVLLPEDIYASWTAEPRVQLGLLYTRILRTLAVIWFERRELDKCIKLYWKIITLDTWDEDSYFALMQCYVLQEKDLQAIKVFQHCEKTLQKELDVSPNQKLQTFMQRILNRRPAALTGLNKKYHLLKIK